MTGSAMILAISSFISTLVSTICMPIGGVFSDKYNRKALIIIVDALIAYSIIISLILFQFNAMTAWGVIIFTGITTTFQSFHMPAFSAIIPTMVPPDKLMRINSISFFFVGAIQIFAQFIAAVLWLFFPIYIILWVDVITFFIALVPLVIIKIPIVVGKQAQTKSSFIQDFKIGFKTLIFIPGLVIIIIMFMLFNFLMMPLKTLMSLYVYGVHGGQAGHFALTLIFFQGGMIIGSLITSLKKNWSHKVRTIFINLVIGMIGYIFLALAPKGSYVIISIGAIVMGITFPISSSVIMTFIQTSVPLDKMGRITSINQSISLLATPIATLLIGPLAELFGIPSLFLYSALLGLIIAGVFWAFTGIREVDFDDKNIKQQVNEKIKNIDI